MDKQSTSQERTQEEERSEDSAEEGVKVEFPELAEEDKRLIWAKAVDGTWFLCEQCDLCKQWVLFPITPHPCLENPTEEGLVEYHSVVEVRPTSVSELAGNMLCQETFLSVEN